MSMRSLGVLLVACACSTGNGNGESLHDRGRGRAESIDQQERRLGPTDPISDRVRVLAAPDDPSRGSKDAPILVVAFLSPTPAAVRAFSDAADALEEIHADEVRVVIKLLPDRADPEALRRARLLVAAATQERFWPVLRCLAGSDAAACGKLPELDARRLAIAGRPELVEPYLLSTRAYAQRVGAAAGAIYVNGFPVAGPAPTAALAAVVAREVKNVERVRARHGIDGVDIAEWYLRGARGGPRPERWLEAETRYRLELDPDEVSLGSPAASVTIVEYGRFDCPYSATGHRVVRELAAQDADVRLVFRAVPSAASLEAHRLASRAADHGRFWEVADAAFARGGVLDAAAIAELRGRLGLSLEADPALDDNARLRRDIGRAAILGVRATPTLFVNGRALVGAPTLAALRQVVEEERARALALRAQRPDRPIYELAIAQGAVEGSPVPPAEEDDEPSEPRADVIHVLPADPAPSLGPAVATHVVTVFTDFTCGDCVALSRSLARLRAQHPGIRIVLRLTPVPDHPVAELAAIVGHAADGRDDLPRILDELYALGEVATDAQVAALVARHGLVVDATAGRARVERDLALASSLGVEMLPAVFVDGRYVGMDLDPAILAQATERACDPEVASCAR